MLNNYQLALTSVTPKAWVILNVLPRCDEKLAKGEKEPGEAEKAKLGEVFEDAGGVVEAILEGIT